MAINIPSKFGSGLPPEKPTDRKGINFHKLNEKLRWERENILPHLTHRLFSLYGDRCDLFVGNYYHGKNHFLNVNFSNESEEYPPYRNAEYDEVGKILAHI